MFEEYLFICFACKYSENLKVNIKEVHKKIFIYFKFHKAIKFFSALLSLHYFILLFYCMENTVT